MRDHAVFFEVIVSLLAATGVETSLETSFLCHCNCKFRYTHETRDQSCPKQNALGAILWLEFMVNLTRIRYLFKETRSVFDNS